jgi:hypothetical protein
MLLGSESVVIGCWGELGRGRLCSTSNSVCLASGSPSAGGTSSDTKRGRWLNGGTAGAHERGDGHEPGTDVCFNFQQGADASAPSLRTLSAAFPIPAGTVAEAPRAITAAEREVNAYTTLRKARSEQRYAGVRAERQKKKDEEEAAKKKVRPCGLVEVLSGACADSFRCRQ